MAYPDFLIRKTSFPEGSFKQNKKTKQNIHIESLVFLTIFEQREVRDITVQRTKESQRKIFSNKDAKIGHFHCLPKI